MQQQPPQQQKQQNYFSGIIALILLIKRLFCAFVNSLANAVEHTEREWDLSYVFFSFFPHPVSHCFEGKRKGEAEVNVSNQTMQILTGGFNIFAYNMAGWLIQLFERFHICNEMSCLERGDINSLPILPIYSIRTSLFFNKAHTLFIRLYSGIHTADIIIKS